MKTLEIQVYEALKSVGLVKDTLSDVEENHMVFTNAMKNQEIIDALKDIEGLSFMKENFSGFGNGILFTIKQQSY